MDKKKIKLTIQAIKNKDTETLNKLVGYRLTKDKISKKDFYKKHKKIIGDYWDKRNIIPEIDLDLLKDLKVGKLPDFKKWASYKKDENKVKNLEKSNEALKGFVILIINLLLEMTQDEEVYNTLMLEFGNLLTKMEDNTK